MSTINYKSYSEEDVKKMEVLIKAIDNATGGNNPDVAELMKTIQLPIGGGSLGPYPKPKPGEDEEPAPEDNDNK